MNKLELWERYKKYLCVAPSLGLELDISRMFFPDDFLESMSAPMDKALKAMDELEKGAIANIDENRMVGHYWLRAPELAPDPAIRSEIEETVRAIKAFANDVHSGAIKPPEGDAFYVVLLIGIGGSALGPQLVADALGNIDDPLIIRFIDNTDPDGIDRVLEELEESLPETLTIVVSKSGGTIETRNGMIEVEHAYRQAGLRFPAHAVAVTCEGSILHRKAVEEDWLRIFPMWDWVGGRTSVTSAVGLLPAALQGFHVDTFLAGARACDVVTRNPDWRQNPAALLAAMWYYAGDARGRRDMVVMPYSDRLALVGRYLQQLVMESLGKRHDRDGNVVNQGLAVYGNKGSTDQHAFVQQLRDGTNDFFATFLNVRRKRRAGSGSIEVEKGVTSSDYLNGFWLGTREALAEDGRESITLTLDQVSARAVGVLVALFERAVGLYAELINVNAYNQPGVEAGKKAAAHIIEVQRRVSAYLADHPAEQSQPGSPAPTSTEHVAAVLKAPQDVETIHHVLASRGNVGP